MRSLKFATSWTPPWTTRGSTWGRWWGRWWSYSSSKSHIGLLNHLIWHIGDVCISKDDETTKCMENLHFLQFWKISKGGPLEKFFFSKFSQSFYFLLGEHMSLLEWNRRISECIKTKDSLNVTHSWWWTTHDPQSEIDMRMNLSKHLNIRTLGLLGLLLQPPKCHYIIT